MIAHVKYLPHILVLAGGLALAGCGGSSDDGGGSGGGGETCSPDFGKKANGDCYTEQEYKDKLQADATKKAEDDAKAKEMSEEVQARAKKLDGYFNATSAAAVVIDPNTRSPEIASGSDLLKALNKAKKASDGMGKEDKATVMAMTVKGAPADAGSTAVTTAALNKGVITGSGFATGSNQRVTHDSMTGTNKAPNRINGSFNGATGIYTCSANNASCTSQRTATGIQLSTGWSFIPNPGQKYNAVAVAEYGWWLNEAENVSAPRIGAWFANAAGTDLTGEDITNSTGTAKYTGKAIGIASFYDSTSPDENVAGAFSANVELNATFGGGDNDMLDGDITGFEIGTVKPEWSVKLKQIGLGDTGTTDSSGTMTQWTIGEGDDAVKGAADGGDWSALLHTMPSGTQQPAGAIGVFDATHGNEGHMIGAFEANQ